MTKTCSSCGESKALSEFTLRKRAKDGHHNQCRTCKGAADRQRRINNRSAYCGYARAYRTKHPSRHSESQLKSRYGITWAEYDTLLARQGGVCAICTQPPTTERLCVDHDHATGAVRGLLCRNCNSVIGQANDSPTLLRNAAEYLSCPNL